VVDGLNPARGVETARGEPCDRVLKGSELAALGKVLAANEAKYPAAVAALRLIALTGLRREEVCGHDTQRGRGGLSRSRQSSVDASVYASTLALGITEIYL
jgi:hypothetical protein